MTTAEWLLLGIVTFILIDFAAGRVIDFLNENSKNAPLSPLLQRSTTLMNTPSPLNTAPPSTKLSYLPQ